MALITCQARPNTWADWRAQPGTDAFGLPWSSWDHSGPMCNCAAGECKFGRQRAEVPAIPQRKISQQMELAL